MQHTAWILALVGFAAACASTTSEPETPKSVASSAGIWRVTELDGDSADLGAAMADGRPVMLVFWQSWCAPCLREAPHVQTAFETYGDRMEIVGVVSGPDSAVDEDAVRRAIAQRGLGYRQVRDRDLVLTNAFDVRVTPTVVIVDPAGRVVYSDHSLPPSLEPYLE